MLVLSFARAPINIIPNTLVTHETEKISMQTLPFKPSDGETVQVPREIVCLMRSVGTMLKDLNLENTVPSEPISIEVKDSIFKKVRLILDELTRRCWSFHMRISKTLLQQNLLGRS